jgi:hypothetical protein
MNYDSEEERKDQEAFSEQLKQTREFLNDKNKVNQLIDSFHQVMELLEPLSKKIIAGEELTEEQMNTFIFIRNSMDKARQQFEDMQSILGQNNLIQADAIFYHFKKLAEEGNEEAKKAYEQLLPKFKAAHGEDFDSPEKKN